MNIEVLPLKDYSEYYTLIKENEGNLKWPHISKLTSPESVEKMFSGYSINKIVVDGSISGMLSLFPTKDGIELGYWMDINHRGKGIMKQVLTYLFKNSKNSTYTARIEANNEASLALAKSVGMVELRRTDTLITFIKET